MLDKLKNLSKKRTFDEMPDMLKDNKFPPLREVSQACVERMKEQAKRAGYNELDVKVVGVGVHLLVRDPTDKNRMAIAQMVVSHEDINFSDLMEKADRIADDDAKKMMSDPDEKPYEPSNYDGMMYG